MTDGTDAKSRFTRRNALRLAGAATGSLVAGRAFAQDAAATADARPSDRQTTAAETAAETAARARRPSPGWQRFQLGDATITPVLDGEKSGDGPFPTFGMDQSQDAMGRLMKANFLPGDTYVTSFSPTLVELDDNLLLFDTGFGENGHAMGLGHLAERMTDAGYTPDDVTIVVLTHFHGDHIQGLMTGGAPTFKNARYVAGRTEYDWWTSDEAKNGEKAGNAKLVEKMIVPLKDKITFIKEGDTVVSGITAHEAFGHTPGHMIFEIESGEKRLMMTGDTANHFVASLQKPDWNVSFDQDHEKANATRKTVFDRIAEERIPFLGYHMPFPAVAYAEKMDGGGYRYVAESYQLAVTEAA